MNDETYTIHVADAPGRRLLEQYLRRRREEIAVLERSLAASDYEGIRRIGHNLHGSGAAYDIKRISALGERLESAAERLDRTELGGVIAALQRLVANIVIASP